LLDKLSLIFKDEQNLSQEQLAGIHCFILILSVQSKLFSFFQELKEAFDYFDTEQKHELGLNELKNISKHLERNMSDQELMAIVKAVNKNESEVIKFEGEVLVMNKCTSFLNYSRYLI
jgi:Ca2+-binding EF-hand superfamily protein